MNKKILIVILVLVVILGGYTFTTYNSLVTLNINADTQWKQVETNYQRRFDLVPDLVESVKGVMKQEQTIFTSISEARTRYAGATTPNEKALAAGQLEGALSRLLVVVENYPTLKTSEVVEVFMAQREGTENRINVERMRYNDMVREYNLKVARVPSSIIASIFGFEERAFFEATAGAEKTPEVKF